MEEQGITPDCTSNRHHHISTASARVLVYGPIPEVKNFPMLAQWLDALHAYGQHEGYGAARWVGSDYRRVCDIVKRVWANAISSERHNEIGERVGPSVMQMVRGSR